MFHVNSRKGRSIIIKIVAAVQHIKIHPVISAGAQNH